MNSEYIPRIIDEEIETKLETFGAINIVGPKWCGKTTTGDHFSKSAIKFQKDPNKDALIETAKLTPHILLNGAKPRLIDEWQDAPQIWDAVRNYCDEHHERGNFILTGSTSKKVNTSHTGTGRISKVKMYPMSLYESGDSNGTISLKDLFDSKPDFKKGCASNLTIEDLIFVACRGGWPDSLRIQKKENQLLVAKDYFNQIYEEDIFKVDDRKRNKATMRALLKSYGRNISTLAKQTNILVDVQSYEKISESTLTDYIEVLEKLFIIEDLKGWCPSIRSKESMRSGRKREFVDPSIAVAALGTSPAKLQLDLKTFGFIFETLCIRDLRVYSSKLGGRLSYYHDRYGLEADCVLHLDDDRYALIEFKLGANGIEEGAKHLCKLESLIIEHNKKEKQCPLRLPDLKIILTGTPYGYKREDGVYVIPIGCLKD